MKPTTNMQDIAKAVLGIDGFSMKNIDQDSTRSGVNKMVVDSVRANLSYEWKSDYELGPDYVLKALVDLGEVERLEVNIPESHVLYRLVK